MRNTSRNFVATWQPTHHLLRPPTYPTTVFIQQVRYNRIVGPVKMFLQRSCGFNVHRDCHFLPVSGLNADNLNTRVGPSTCDWYSGPSLMELLDSIPAVAKTEASDEPVVRDVKSFVATIVVRGQLIANEHVVVA